MIQLAKQQCANCRNGRPFSAAQYEIEDPDLDGTIMCHLAANMGEGILLSGRPTHWCSGWELHPDYYEIFGFPSEEVQLEQQRMLLQMHGGDPAPSVGPATEFTYD